MTGNLQTVFREAGELWQTGDHPTAIALCRKILEVEPANPDALNLLGLAQFSSGEFEAAAETLERASAARRRPDILNNLGLAQKKLERTNDAMDSFLAAIALDDNFAEGHANLGRLLRQAGNDGGALKHLRRAVAINPNLPRPHSDLANILVRRDRLDLASEHLAQHLTLALPTARVTKKPAVEKPPAKAEKPVDKPAVFRAALAEMKRLLDGAGIEYFLGDGTALGCVRERNFISFDKDMDLGIDAAVPRGRILQLLDESTEFWVDVNRDPNLSEVLICGTYRNAAAIDLFFYHRAGDYVWHGLRHAGYETRWRQTPFALQPVEFLGERHLLPANPERYLSELYENWRTPDPHYCGYVTGDIVGGLPLMAKCYAMQELQRAMGAGEKARALAVAVRLRDRLRLYEASPPLAGALDQFIEHHSPPPAQD